MYIYIYIYAHMYARYIHFARMENKEIIEHQ